MSHIPCGSDGSCPFLYMCHAAKNQCIHDSIFPLFSYEIGIFCIFPFASAICNLSGNSFGEWKVLLLMDLLNYTESAATTLSYPLTVGTALFNFFYLIPKRHPSKNTSLIDYNIIMVLIPNILYGSTLGSLANKFLPPIIADSLVLPLLIAFSIKFFLRFLNFRKQGKLKDQEIKQGKSIPKSSIKQQQIQLSSGQKSEINKQNEQNLSSNTERVHSKLLEQKVQQNQNAIGGQLNPFAEELQKHELYESTYHWWHILATLVIFGVFETLSFLAQGKIIFFTICTDYYVIGVGCLTILFFGFDIGMYFYTKNRMRYYRLIGYNYDGNLDAMRNYLIICLGGFFGGFNGGVFGIGNSTTIIFSLLFLNMEASVVAATVGFQVVFSGLANLAEAFATNSINGDVALLFLGITLIAGGILSFVLKYLTRNLNVNKLNQVLMLVVCGLTGLSSLSLIANIVIEYNSFGSQYMISVPFSC